MGIRFTYISLFLGFLFLSGCGKDRGIGPVKEVQLSSEIDQNLVKIGESAYERKCKTCHRLDSKLIGSPLKGVTKNRTPEWIMNMILNPEGMVKEDPIAKQLLIEYNGSPMANQNLTEEEARAVLEYFRTLK